MIKKVKNMKHSEMIWLPPVLYRILQQNTDRENRLSMPQLLAMLEEEGFQADRRSVYKAIHVLKENGVEVIFDKTGGKQGYRLVHLFTPAESMYLISAVRDSFSLTPGKADLFAAKIRSLMSRQEELLLPEIRQDVIHTENEQVLEISQKLLEAIRDCVFVDFRYYDMTVSRQKKYRRNSERYHLVPYAVVSSGGRFYCVFYSPVHQNFANYRIDKMDNVTCTSLQADPVPFSLADHMRSSFQMYHGEARTITAEFDLSLSSQVFDSFGTDLIISKVTDRTFIASFRTAITPPLISWLLQYPSFVRVIRPQELIDRLMETADTIHNTYQKEGKK